MLKPTGKQKQITARFLSPGAEVDSLFGESLWEPGLTGEFGMQDALLPYNLMVIKGSLDAKLPSYELLKMLKVIDS